MKTIKITIEKTADLYTAYAEDVEGVYAGGKTIADVKESVEEAIRLKENNSKEHIPEILQDDYQSVFNFDVESLLNYYKGIFSNSVLDRLTGINQKQLQHYSTGHRKPRPEQRKKIEAALHKLGEELLAVEL